MARELPPFLSAMPNLPRSHFEISMPYRRFEKSRKIRGPFLALSIRPLPDGLAHLPRALSNFSSRYSDLDRHSGLDRDFCFVHRTSPQGYRTGIVPNLELAAAAILAMASKGSTTVPVKKTAGDKPDRRTRWIFVIEIMHRDKIKENYKGGYDVKIGKSLSGGGRVSRSNGKNKK